MSDLISRSKAIRWVKAECNPYGQPTLDYESGIKVIEHLERMPSAEKTQLPEEDATSVCKCPCVYREPCDVCHYDGHLGLGCPAERRGEQDG